MVDEDHVAAWLAREIRAHQRKSPKRFQLSEAALHAHALYEANVAALPFDHLACRAGCGTCCCAHVGAEDAEGFAIVRHLRAMLAPAETEALMARAAEVADKVAGFDPGARWGARIPCVFQHPERRDCTIYAVRPLACRGYTSTDLGACLEAAKSADHGHPIPADAERMVRSRAVRRALADATARTLGQDAPCDHGELHAQVVKAWRAGDELAWLRGVRR